MTDITLTQIRKRFGATEVLRGIDLTIQQGSVLALLGPSGCGKTTLLRLIAGFDRLDAGTIRFGDRTMASPALFVPPEHRGIGYVPQEGSLFPHLTVEGNVRFGLKRKDSHVKRVAEVLELTGLGGLGKRFPHELSGGQQQRVALARALAPGPTLVLLDEPFNALDLDLRRSVCEDVTAVLRQTGTTTVLVTHDPGEAFAVSDRLAVMEAGQIMQHAHPEHVYWQPANPSVARLTGSTLFLPGQVNGNTVQCGLGTLPLYPSVQLNNGPASAMVRPEQVQWSEAGGEVAAKVVHRSFRGDHTIVGVELQSGGAGGQRMPALDLRLPSLAAPALGAKGCLQVVGSSMAYTGI